MNLNVNVIVTDMLKSQARLNKLKLIKFIKGNGFGRIDVPQTFI